MAKATIVGAGMMGSAMCWPLRDNGHAVWLVGTHLDREIIAGCRDNGWHSSLKRRLPEGVQPFQIEGLPQAMEGVELVVQGVSSPGVEWFARAVAPDLDQGTPILAITKGLALGGNGLPRILPDVVEGLLPDRLRGRIPMAAVGGPCIAGELAGRRPTCVLFAGRDGSVVDSLAGMLSTAYYRVWTSTDLVGVETCAALKNGYALGIALAHGLMEKAGGPDEAGAQFHNLAAELFAQAGVEMTRIVALMGGDTGWVNNLPGIGDLFVTVRGGRTSAFGRLLGSGLDIVETRRRLAGVTLESADVIRVLGEAIPQLEARGQLRSDDLPLLRHLVSIVSAGAPCELPLVRFCGTPVDRASHPSQMH
jgi:glycerol-3-phosphate dehydrogenase (NAD(P)+)